MKDEVVEEADPVDDEPVPAVESPLELSEDAELPVAGGEVDAAAFTQLHSASPPGGVGAPEAAGEGVDDAVGEGPKAPTRSWASVCKASAGACV